MLKKFNFKIVEKFKIFICIALAVVLMGGVFMIIRAASGSNVMNFGIDFTGGAVIDLDLSTEARDAGVKSAIEKEVKAVITNPEYGLRMEGEMTTSDSSDGITFEWRIANQYKGSSVNNATSEEFITFVKIDLCNEITKKIADLTEGDGEAGVEADQAFVTAKVTLPDTDEKYVTAYIVGPSAAASLISKAAIALLVAIVLMLVYIVIRFTASSALAAVCALVHDVLIMVALTTALNIPVNSTFIAAVITIVGYSINATIIIFDRIREELKTSGAKDKTDTEIANLAIKDTLNRTILTTVTTLVMVVVLAFFSVSTISEFIIPIIFGLLAGAFSSVLLAPSFWVAFRKVAKKIKAKREAKKGYVGKTAAENADK